MSTPTIYDVTVELMDYQQFLDYAADNLNYAGQTEMLNSVSQKLRSMPYSSISSLTTQEQWAEQIMAELRSNGYEIQYNGNNQWTGSVFPSTAQVSTTNPINSNITNVGRGNIRNWYGGLNEFSQTGLQTWVPTRMPVSGGLGSKAMYFLGSVGSAVGAVSTGIWLGKTFDSALYNAMPDFWNSIGWSTLNPETWGSLTAGSDSPFAGLLNFILGIDGTNGNAQAYISEDMLAYMAYGLYNAGVFTDGNSYNKVDSGAHPDVSSTDIYYISGSLSDNASLSNYYSTLPLLNFTKYVQQNIGYAVIGSRFNTHPTTDLKIGFVKYSTTQTAMIVCNPVSYDDISYLQFRNVINDAAISSGGLSFSGVYSYNNKTVYYKYMYWDNSEIVSTSSPIINSSYSYLDKIAWSIVYGNSIPVGGETINGIGNQDGATLPDTTGWDDLSNVLPSLQQQYPDAFQNPMIWNSDTPYDDTAGNQTRYIPVPFPIANSLTDTQPLSGTQTQTNTSLNTTPQEIQDWITKAIQQTSTQPATPPANPVDTGTGNTPVPTAPTGEASALWSVYHPTQAQVNSFGAWLWGSPFLTNIGKLFQNPIEGVISLHKVFVTPVDAGTGNIVVGTLDSGVSSNTVSAQYVEVDCGYVSLNENFGNVFDYDPYTKVALYLPFIGIVPLNVADVMRSTINVKYGVDLFTGACIAMVSVSRDGNDATLYQYSGNCAVHYPLSNVQQSQLLSGLITVAAGVGSIVATGGAAAPAAATGIVSGAMSALKSNVGRSGGFSANAGAMGIKVPYLIIERPQTKVADTFPRLAGYPTNYSCKLGDCSNHVVVKHVHVEGIPATDTELAQIESLLKDGVLI